MANYQITAPDGTKYQITAPDNATQDQVLAYAQSQHVMQSKPTAPESSIATQGKRIAGGAEGDFNALGNAASAPVAGIGGLLGALKATGANALNAVGFNVDHENVGDTAQNWMNNTSQFMNAPRFTIGTPEAQQGKSYQEGNQAAQQGISAVTGAIPYAVEKGIDLGVKGAGKVLPQSAQGALARVNASLQGIGNIGANLIGPQTALKIPGFLKPTEFSGAVSLTPKQQLMQMGQQKYGLKFSPSETEGNPVASAATDITGSAMAEKLATRKNQPVVNSIGANEINQPGIPNFTNANLKAATKDPTAMYNSVGKIGTVPTDDNFRSDFASLNLNPRSKGTIPNDTDPRVAKMQDMYGNLKSFDAQDALNTISDLRSNGWKNVKTPNDAEKNQLGAAQLRAADAFENQLDRYIGSRPDGFSDPGMIQKWRDARTLLAKIHTIKAARVGTDLSVPKLTKAYDNGAPLSGGLLDLAQLGEAFPASLKDASKVRGPKTFTKWDATFGGGGALGAVALGHPVLAGSWLASVAAQPLVREGLMTDFAQSRLTPQPMSQDLLKLIAPAAAQALFTGNQK